MRVSMISCLPADESLPFSSMDTLSVLWIICRDFSSHEWVCSEKCVLQNHEWLRISLVLSPFPPCLTARAMDGTFMLGVCARSFGADRVGWHLCETTLWTLVAIRRMAKQLVQKHPGSLLPILYDLIYFSFCVLMNSKADFRDSWMVEYVC